jgi:hypothetical protein
MQDLRVCRRRDSNPRHADYDWRVGARFRSRRGWLRRVRWSRRRSDLQGRGHRLGHGLGRFERSHVVGTECRLTRRPERDAGLTRRLLLFPSSGLFGMHRDACLSSRAGTRGPLGETLASSGDAGVLRRFDRPHGAERRLMPGIGASPSNATYIGHPLQRCWTTVRGPRIAGDRCSQGRL